MEYRYSVIEAIISLNPDARGGTSVKKDDDIDNCVITWKEGISEISKEDIKTEMDRLQVEYNAKEWERSRVKEYPTIEECVHAILDDDLENLQILRQAVKDKFPKENN